MDYSHYATQDTQQALKTAIDNKDFAAFSASYKKFLDQFDMFRASYSASPTDVQCDNPIFGKKGFFLKQTNDAQAVDMLQKAKKASHAMEQVPLSDRLELLAILEQKLGKYQDAITTTISADTGKPIDLSKGEMGKGKEWFDYAREQAAAQIGEGHVKNLTNRHKPLGAVQVIGAFNYPYALAIGGVVGAIAAGNGVVVASPMKSPNWVFPFMQAAKEAVQQFVNAARAQGKPYAETLAKHADGLFQYNVGVNKLLTKEANLVHFVGSDMVGEMIRTSRGAKPTVLEMGGSNVVAIMESAKEIMPAAKIAETIYKAFGPASGQRCTAPRFLCVQEGANDVVESLKDICRHGLPGSDPANPFGIGNPFDAGVQMGPMVDRNSHQAMKQAIELAQQLGAEVCGHIDVSNNVVPLAGSDGSYWVNPIVIDWSKVMGDPDKALQVQNVLKNEIFGPLVHIVQKVNTLDDAIAVTKKLDNHGLAAAIFTGNAADVEHYAHEVSVTSLAVNGAPKDQSPRGPHGHPGLATIGGGDHFGLYSQKSTIARMA